MSSAIAYPTNFAIIFVAATLVGYIAHRLGQPTRVSYILTGVILGPVGLNIVVEEGLVEIMSSLGLGFLLFLLGIKMHFDEIKEIFRPIVNIAGSQILLQQSLAFLVAYLLGFPLWQAFVIGLCTIFGATPVIVKVLTDKDEIRTLPGRINVGVLIGQDIYLVIALALLGIGTLAEPLEVATTVVKILILIAAISIVTIASSRYVLPKIFKKIADNKEVFFLFTIAWAFLFIYASKRLELSIEVGAFLAGLGLAQLPYSRELEDRIKPITDFFILVFFSTIGLRLVADELFYYWKEAVIASVILVFGNFLIMFYLIYKEDFSVKTSFIGSINMIQVSEFSLVVGALAVAQGFIEIEVLGYLSLMALMTMSASTYIIANNHKIYERVKHLFKRLDTERKDVDLKKYSEHAVVIGYDNLAEKLVPVLKEHFEHVLILDSDAEKIVKLDSQGLDNIYGDFRYGEVRRALNLKDASFVFSSISDIHLNSILLDNVGSGTKVFIECEWKEESDILHEMGADHVLLINEVSILQLFKYVEDHLNEMDRKEKTIDQEKGGEIKDGR